MLQFGDLTIVSFTNEIIMKRTSIIVPLVIAIIVVSLWVSNNNKEKRIFTNVVLKIHQLPSSVDFIDREIRSFVDHQAEYGLTVNKNDFNKLMSGRKYSPCEKVKSRKQYYGLIDHKAYELSGCYISDGVDYRDRVHLYHNAEKTKLIIVYTN